MKKTTLALLALTTAAAAAPLAPMPDNGFVSDAHKQRVGDIVFAKTESAITTPEKIGEFVDKFALTDSIFLRAYLPRSLRNAFRADGVECVRDEAFRVWDLTIDGKPVVEGDTHFYMEPAPDNQPIYTKSTSIRFDHALNAKGDLSERSLWRAFGDHVVPKLAAGKHAITLSVTGTCTANAAGYPRVQLSAPMATGTFELTVSDKALAGAGALGTQMPKPAMKNPKLEREMLDIMKRKWAQDQIFRVVIVEKDWTIRRNEISGLAIERELATMLTSKGDDGKCRMFPVTFAQPSRDGHGTWGATDYHSVGDAIEISCANAQK